MRQATAFEVIAEALMPLAGKLVLDLGCGRGALAAPLAREGAAWTGIDPTPPAAPLAPVIRASAADLPFGPGRFDAAVFLNSLHHVPQDQMGAALSAAARTLRPGGRLISIEPLATGALFQVIRPVDDETEVRAAAQAALDAATAAGTLLPVAAFDYERTERYRDFEEFVQRMLAPDPARAAAFARHRDTVAARFTAYAGQEAGQDGGQNGGRLTLSQPMRARIFAPG